MKILGSSLADIEKEIIRLHKTIHNITWGFENGDLPPTDEEANAEMRSAEMDIRILEIQRQHILDRRNGWLQKLIFTLIIPIIVTILTTYLMYKFGLN